MLILRKSIELIFSVCVLLLVCFLLLRLIPGRYDLDEMQTIPINRSIDYFHSWVEPDLPITEAIQRGLSTTLQIGGLALVLTYFSAFFFVWLYWKH